MRTESFSYDDHREITADTRLVKLISSARVVMMIDVALCEIHVRAKLGERALKTFRRS